MSYNGWANWETWKVNLELLDGDEYADELVAEAGNTWDGADAIKDYVENYVDEQLDQIDGYFIAGVINGFLREVNWREIAEHHKPDEWGDSDEAPEDEDERIDSDEWQAGIEAIRDREGREDRMSDRAIYNEARLDAYDVYDTPAGCRGCGAVISRGEQHARSCENAED